MSGAPPLTAGRLAAPCAPPRGGALSSPRALCIALCTIMLLPLLASVLASFKTTVEAAAVPPTYFPHALSLDNYRKLWSFQAGPADLSRQQRRGGAADHPVLPAC